MRARAISHSIYKHLYHIVWGTKYRRKYLKPYVRDEFERHLYEVVKERYPELWITKINTDEDHVHLAIEIPPNIAVSEVIKRLKWHSSRHLRRKFKFIGRMYIGKGIWSVGYYSSTVGIGEEVIKRYIEYQGRKDKPEAVQLELS